MVENSMERAKPVVIPAIVRFAKEVPIDFFLLNLFKTDIIKPLRNPVFLDRARNAIINPTIPAILLISEALAFKKL